MDTNLSTIRKTRRAVDDLLLHLAAQIQRVGTAALCDVSTSKGNCVWGGRTVGSRNVHRSESTWCRDYLGEGARYPPKMFRRRFGVPRFLFYKLRDDLVRLRPNYWGQRKNGVGKLGIPSNIKVLTCLRLLRTGRACDDFDDSSKMAEETVRGYFRSFCADIISIYGAYYLNRRPSHDELVLIEKNYKDAGFPGCGGCLDCMKMSWKNCPLAMKGQYLNTKDSNMATIVAEGWCDRNLYIWNWYCGRPGTNNDLTVLENSPVLRDLLSGHFHFQLRNGYQIIPGGQTRYQMYMLVDGIYPEWAMFVKPLNQQDSINGENYNKLHEAVRKDIERAFGVLQSRFEILRREHRRWSLNDIIRVCDTCVILHNLIITIAQAGGFEDEAEGTNIVTELYAMEQQGVEASNKELLENKSLQEALEEEYYAEEEFRVMMREYGITSRNCFQGLQNDLITRVSNVLEDGEQSM